MKRRRANSSAERSEDPPEVKRKSQRINMDNLQHSTQAANHQLEEGPGSSVEGSKELDNSEGWAVASFLGVVNNIIRGNDNPNPISEATAMKFLISRKFDVPRALDLYRMHEITRLREGLANIDSGDEYLQAELNSGKFTVLDRRDPNDSAIAIFTAKLHAPTKSSRNSGNKRMVHRYTLQGIVYQLDVALDDVVTQRNGVVFIYNMCDSDYSNFDYELCQKILNLLKGAYPAKLKKVLIVSPPLWFRAPFHLLRLIVREKLRDRVWLLSKEQLLDHVPSQALPQELGGNYVHNHSDWISRCVESYQSRNNDLCDPASAQNLVDSLDRNSNKGSSLSKDFSATSDTPNNHVFKPRGQSDHGQHSAEAAFDYDDIGVSLVDFVETFKMNLRKGLSEEYDYIKLQKRPGTTNVANTSYNSAKNRYTNILPYDHTRVILAPYDLPDNMSAKFTDPFDYINACYIDGYRQPRAYISTQGPKDTTCMDFWRMIWQTGCRVIAMFALVVENGILKCHQYWPTEYDPPLSVGVYKIEFVEEEHHTDYTVTRLKLTNSKLRVSRTIWHFQYTSWPDFGTPTTAAALLEFREHALRKQLDALDLTGSVNYPPLVVHCSAGVGRTGTFITIDICIQKLETTGLVDVKSVVDKLRYQRGDSIQTDDQYIFCYRAILEYALSCGILEDNELREMI